MAKKSTTRAFQDAQHSRLTPDQIEEVEYVEEGEGVVEEINMEQELQAINDKIAENDIVCTMELTKGDVEALLFSISRTFEDYEMEGHEYQTSLESLKVGLEGVC
jgi:hypothetical protein